MADSQLLTKISKEEVLTWNRSNVQKYLVEKLASMLEGEDLVRFKAMKVTGKLFLLGTTMEFWEKAGISAGTSLELSELSSSLKDEQATPKLQQPLVTPKQKKSVADARSEHTPNSSQKSSLIGTSPEPEFWDEARDWIAKMKEQATLENWSVDLFSNPHNHLQIPFPVPGEDVPKDYFLLDNDKKFHFMGRTAFKQFYEYATSSIRTRRLHGIEGIGTSYNLAALAALLLVEGKRVFYIPDCNEFELNDPIRQFRRAIYTAFHNRPEQQAKATKLSNEDDVRTFFSRHRGKIIFLIGQCQALEETDPLNTAGSERKQWLWRLLSDVSFGYQRVFCTSGNHLSSRLAQARAQRGSREYVDLWKGFDEVCTRRTLMGSNGKKERVKYYRALFL